MKVEELLIDLALESIKSVFDPSLKFDKENLIKQNSSLGETRATFITLTLDGKLRGCIGSLIAHRTLLDDILHNAKAAAFADPRFNKLTQKEFLKIKIEISLLSPAKVLEYSDFEDLKNKLESNKPGVILELNNKRATFLPQVWEQLPTFNEFMSHLCKKAGLDPLNLNAFPKIETYEAQKIKQKN